MACKILIVDDDEMMRIFLRDVFWVHGGGDEYEVEAVKNITEADTYLKDTKKCPDVVFLDLSTPAAGGKSGAMQIGGALAFMQKVKKEKPCGKDIPFVIFSGYDDPKVKEKAKEAGADDYLVKGEYMPKELIDFVRENYVNKP